MPFQQMIVNRAVKVTSSISASGGGINSFESVLEFLPPLGLSLDWHKGFP
jgi:hypothetical protein